MKNTFLADKGKRKCTSYIIIYSIMNNLSTDVLLCCYAIAPARYKSVIEEIALRKMVLNEEYLSTCKNGEVRLIDQGEYDYPLANVCFINNMITLCLYSLWQGYLPYIQFKNSMGTDLWNQYFEQPFPNVVMSGNETSIERVKVDYHFSQRLSYDDISMLNKLFSRFFRFNKKTTEYIDNEYAQLIGNKSVLGVLVRGTDLKSEQPDPNAVIMKTAEIFASGKYEMIYLATEEKRIESLFISSFPGKIITNKREYYDSFYEFQSDDARISWAKHSGDNGNYYKILEYLSSVCILSKCNGLIGGCCGGTQLAQILNGNKYQYKFIF